MSNVPFYSFGDGERKHLNRNNFTFVNHDVSTYRRNENLIFRTTIDLSKDRANEKYRRQDLIHLSSPFIKLKLKGCERSVTTFFFPPTNKSPTLSVDVPLSKKRLSSSVSCNISPPLIWWKTESTIFSPLSRPWSMITSRIWFHPKHLIPNYGKRSREQIIWSHSKHANYGCLLLSEDWLNWTTWY